MNNKVELARIELEAAIAQRNNMWAQIVNEYPLTEAQSLNLKTAMDTAEGDARQRLQELKELTSKLDVPGQVYLLWAAIRI